MGGRNICEEEEDEVERKWKKREKGEIGNVSQMKWLLA